MNYYDERDYHYRPRKRGVWLAFVLGMALMAVGFGCFMAVKDGVGSKEEAGEGDRTTLSESGIVQFIGEGLLPSPAFAQGTGDKSLADIAEVAAPSIVNISARRVITTRARDPFGDFFSDPLLDRLFRRPQRERQREESSLGSGVIISDKGIVVTNNHVVNGAQEIVVGLTDGRSFEADVIGVDEGTDLAVLRLQAPEGSKSIEDIKPISFGDSSRLRVADWVMAIGNPFGLHSTVTVGIVSAKSRTDVGILDKEDFIQTDAAINPGNSGGALLDMEGNLVGINTAILSKSGGYQGIGFAIPSNLVMAVSENIIRNGKVLPGWLGVTVQELDKETKEFLNIKSGVKITEISPDSPAAEAGLQEGDVLEEVNRQKVGTPKSLGFLMTSLGEGATVSLRVFRDGQLLELPATLGKKSEAVASEDLYEVTEGHLDGASLATLTEDLRSRYSELRKAEAGVAVMEVQGRSAASQIVRAGDVIEVLNDKEIKSIEDFKANYKPRSRSISLRINRGGSTFFVRFN